MFCYFAITEISDTSERIVTVFRTWRLLAIQRAVFRVKVYVSSVALLQRTFGNWRNALHLQINVALVVYLKADRLIRKFLATWKFQFALSRKSDELVWRQAPRIAQKCVDAWRQLLAAKRFARLKNARFPIRRFFQLWRNFRVDTIARLVLHTTRRDRKFVGKVLHGWRLFLFARLKKRVGNLKLLAAAKMEIDWRHMSRVFECMASLGRARRFRDRKLREISVHSWVKYLVQRKVKKRRLEISLHKFVLERSADLARLLITTHDTRKSQRMQQLLTAQCERVETVSRYFQLWRGLVN